MKNKSADVYYELAKLYMMMGINDSVMANFTRSADKARAGNYWKGLNKALCQMASVCWSTGKNLEGSQYANEAIEAGKKANYVRGTGIGYLQAGNIYQNLGRTEESLQHYLNASKCFDECDFKSGVASCWTNIAGIYYTLENFEMALEYDRKAMELQKSLGNKGEVANVMQNMAAIYSGFNRQGVVTKYQHMDSAFYYYQQAATIYEELKDSLNIVRTRCNLGLTYMMISDWRMSKKYFDDAYKIALAKNYISDIIAIENGYAMMYQKKGEFEKSKEYFLKVYPRIIEGNYLEKEFMWYRDMARTLDSLSDYQGALRYYERYVDMHDTLRKHDVERQINQLNARYGSELKDQEIAAAKERQELMSREQDALRKRFLIMVGASILIAIFLIFVVYLLIQVRKSNKKLAEQNDMILKQSQEIERQRDEVTAQKEQIEVQQKNILDSIHYASRIQTAILPRPELVEDLFHDHRFILFKPRDIVSGDYYWIGKKAQWKIAVAADCTGHGVPGAFMSMLGTAFLNEIINDPTMPDIHAGEILNKLRENIIKALKQTGAAGEQKDGMDLAMWMFDEETRQLRFAGANNPLILVRKDFIEGEVPEDDRVKIHEFISETNGETYHIIQVAGGKQPIAIYPEMVPFEEYCITLKPGDTLYTFSDGFQDQFGGEKGKKFMIKRLKQVFVNIYESPMSEQRELLDHELVDWIEKGNTEQVDDVLVIGYRV
ncbi:MAG: tetratricopeptide repeat protein [Bacteroidales bacterium]|nr:tetratricopeptide repeat protein [Bacteroidales bacterium]